MTDRFCRCCGQSLPDPHVLGIRVVGLQQRILRAVHQVGPNGLQMDTLVERVYGDRRDGGPDDPETTIRVHINQLNKKLKPLRKRVRAHGWGRAGSGTYCLEDLPK